MRTLHNLDLADIAVLMQDCAFQQPERSRFESIFHARKTVLSENAGHFVQQDAADTITEAIRNFYR